MTSGDAARLEAHNEVIEKLVSEPPTFKPAGRDRFYRWSAIVALVVAFGALGLAVKDAEHSSSVATCVNNNLGDRDQSNNDDRAATKALATAEVEALIQRGPSTVPDLIGAFKTYLVTLAQSDKTRAANPIGRC